MKSRLKLSDGFFAAKNPREFGHYRLISQNPPDRSQTDYSDRFYTSPANTAPFYSKYGFTIFQHQVSVLCGQPFISFSNTIYESIKAV
ncbi:hypothetical protein PL75_09685 [Neisseria arctica]|uniref:Uncharacterized protein n=1 Tax=Neisseria arctica TaxID=1470200 RepID=A0A0J0YPQ1_9NEIS|nr:hypothetical protein PL75_09685 [Neisseria arctica]